MPPPRPVFVGGCRWRRRWGLGRGGTGAGGARSAWSRADFCFCSRCARRTGWLSSCRSQPSSSLSFIRHHLPSWSGQRWKAGRAAEFERSVPVRFSTISARLRHVRVAGHFDDRTSFACRILFEVGPALLRQCQVVVRSHAARRTSISSGSMAPFHALPLLLGNRAARVCVRLAHGLQKWRTVREPDKDRPGGSTHAAPWSCSSSKSRAGSSPRSREANASNRECRMVGQLGRVAAKVRCKLFGLSEQFGRCRLRFPAQLHPGSVVLGERHVERARVFGGVLKQPSPLCRAGADAFHQRVNVMLLHCIQALVLAQCGRKFRHGFALLQRRLLRFPDTLDERIVSVLRRTGACQPPFPPNPIPVAPSAARAVASG